MFYRSLLSLHLCGRRDSNPYALRHQILSLAWLPITTRPHIKDNKNALQPFQHALYRSINVQRTNIVKKRTQCKRTCPIPDSSVISATVSRT